MFELAGTEAPAESNPSSLLARFEFGNTGITHNGSMSVNSGLQLLEHSNFRERWVSQLPTSYGYQQVSLGPVTGSLHWNKNQETLFIGLVTEPIESGDIRQIAFSAYIELLQFVKKQDYPYLARVWNYMPQINKGNGDNETYKQFCLGRYQAFSKANIQAQNYPAASALGHFDNRLIIYLIATNLVPTHISNPQQTDAYNYPREYGPVGPSFARATYLPCDPKPLVFISGTASIRGHASLHNDSLEQQTRLTCENIELTLLETQNKLGLAKKPCIKALKIYLRNPQHVQEARQLVEQFWPSHNETILITHAEVCRSELLIEIEAVCEVR